MTAPPPAEVAGLAAQGSESSNPDERLASARREAARLHDALAHEQARVRNVVVELAALKEEREALSKAEPDGFTTEEEAAWFLEKIRAMGEATGLKVSQLESSPPVRYGTVLMVSAEMTAVGSLFEFAAFCHSVAKLPQPVTLGNVDLKFGDGREDFESSPVVASYSVSAYALRPPTTV